MNSNSQQLRAILFDLDGTLLDSFPAHYRAYEVLFAHFDMELTPESFRQTYSPNWLAMYEAWDIPRELWAEADEIWLTEAGKQQPQLFPDTRPILDDLHKKYILGLVTSGSRDRVFRDLVETGIGDLFQVIITGGDITKPKPDPEGLQLALSELDLQPFEALYVGDAWEDCRMAQAASVPFIGIAREFASVRGVEDCILAADLWKLLAVLEGG